MNKTLSQLEAELQTLVTYREYNRYIDGVLKVYEAHKLISMTEYLKLSLASLTTHKQCREILINLLKKTTKNLTYPRIEELVESETELSAIFKENDEINNDHLCRVCGQELSCNVENNGFADNPHIEIEYFCINGCELLD